MIIIMTVIILSQISVMFGGSPHDGSTVIVCAGRWVPLLELWTVAALSGSPVYT